MALHSSNLPTIDDMADMLEISRSTLQRQLKTEGVTYKQLTMDFRMKLAQFYLQQTQLSAAEIGHLVSYTEPVNFYRSFKAYFGVTPSEARQALDSTL